MVVWFSTADLRHHCCGHLLVVRVAPIPASEPVPARGFALPGAAPVAALALRIRVVDELGAVAAGDGIG